MTRVVMRRPNRARRTEGIVGLYAGPRQEFARLTRAKVLLRLSSGDYTVTPDDQVEDQEESE